MYSLTNPSCTYYHLFIAIYFLYLNLSLYHITNLFCMCIYISFIYLLLIIKYISKHNHFTKSQNICSSHLHSIYISRIAKNHSKSINNAMFSSPLDIYYRYSNVPYFSCVYKYLLVIYYLAIYILYLSTPHGSASLIVRFLSCYTHASILNAQRMTLTLVSLSICYFTASAVSCSHQNRCVLYICTHIHICIKLLIFRSDAQRTSINMTLFIFDKE